MKGANLDLNTVIFAKFLMLIFSLSLGLILGSFANLYFYRIPRGLSLNRPASFCTHCNSSIAWYDNIPVLSFLLLKGKCRSCHEKISWRYPLVEIFCAALFVVVSMRLVNIPHWELFPILIFSYLLFLIGGIDFVTYRNFGKQYGIIPNHLIWILIVLGLAFSPFNPFLEKGWYWSIVGGLFGTIFMLCFRLICEKIFKQEALGLGDVKTLSAIGFFLGWRGVMITFIVGSFIGTLTILPFVFFKQLDRKSSVPFGPFLAIGAWVTLLIHNDFYL